MKRHLFYMKAVDFKGWIRLNSIVTHNAYVITLNKIREIDENGEGALKGT